jgi:hypothetical protein
MVTFMPGIIAREDMVTGREGQDGLTEPTSADENV